ncbi:transketolase [Brachybacterium ginsengisoli]|uniref:Transketolase n=1 Tax=Brachybacterium ginsengisoli TaxID=1331682 RepID=A0A291H1I1_9MICO|nr:transketolase [Brachybacterium ginsengisoli]ATG56323.1 transketolase [Brachybacterium ginsengisoli]
MTTTRTSPDPERILRLREAAFRIRQYALIQAEVQGQGYIGQALDISDVLAVLFTDQLQLDPLDPESEDRDRFQLSIGHYALALYAALTEAKFFPVEELSTYASDDSRFPMSSMRTYTPGVEISGGSLGHGLGIANGVAMGLKRKGSDRFVYNLLSDGELGEGSTWEAAAVAAHHSLDNLIAIVDFNDQQADGKSTHMLSMEPVTDKFEAFGWIARRCDGHDIEELLTTLVELREIEDPRPRVLIVDTTLGKGVDFLEEREKLHFMKVDEEEWARAHEKLAESHQALTQEIGR